MFVPDFECQNCIECGCYFGVPAGFTAERRKDQQSFFCPNGHQMAYKESELDRVLRDRDRLAQRVAERDDEIARQKLLRETAERSASAARGQVTKIRNRVGSGVCPCCNRTLKQLAAHMANKHPTFKAEQAA